MPPESNRQDLAKIIEESHQNTTLPPEKKGSIIGPNGETREKQDNKIIELLKKSGFDLNQTIEEAIFNKKNKSSPKP